MNRGLGAFESPFDIRTRHHQADLAAPLPETGGVIYAPADIEDQYTVGICTAISLVQNAEKATGKKYSPDFQYLLQKKFFDGNWIEGSSIFSALSMGKNYGFLPIELFTYVTVEDRKLPYADYIAKLQAIPDAEVQRLIGLCVNKLAGYAQLAIDPQSLARGILDSTSGVLCRYAVGDEWWTAPDGVDSWSPADIDPLRAPKVVISGHAISKTYFDFTVNLFTLANTWGTTWDVEGNAHINPSNYSCLEAWIPYYTTLPAFTFQKNLWFGMRNSDVAQLQKRLGVLQTGFFWFLTFKAVRAYQKAHGIPTTGFVGVLTRNSLNSTA